MTTLEEVFLQLEKNEEDDFEMSDLNKTHLQKQPPKPSRSNSYQTLQCEGNSTEENITTDVTLVKNEESIPMKAKDQKISMLPITTTPKRKRILLALLKIRILKMIRDFKLLYSMILFPLVFSSIGLFFIGNKTVERNVESLILNEDTYKDGMVIAIHNHTNHSLDKFVSHFSSKVQLDWYDESLYSLLNESSRVRMAAINITQCCNVSNLSLAVFYNDTQIHSLPIVINSINSAVYRMTQAEKSAHLYGNITVSTNPFQEVFRTEKFDLSAFPVSFWLGLALVQAPASLAVDMVYDREIKAKNQLRVNGLSFMAYFGSYFITFTTIMLIICSAMLSLIFIFKLAFVNQPALVLQFVAIIFFYCPSSLIFLTCISYFFDKAESAHSVLHNISVFVGLIPFIIIVSLDLVKIDIFPFHVLLTLIDPLYTPFAVFYFINQGNAMCHTTFSCSKLTFFDYLTKENITLIIGGFFQIPLFSCVLYFLDLRQSGGKFCDFFRKMFKSEQKFVQEPEERDECITNEGNDVKAERQRVKYYLSRNSTSEHPVILVHNLRKEYQSQSTYKTCCKEKEEARVAVNNLSFAVGSGEIFGLLGHNGAGKTTAIRIITAEEAPTKGRVQINGYNVTSGFSYVFQFVGYCPQHDAQWKNITVREHLELYSSIRGVPPGEIQNVVDSFLSGLQIQEHADKQSQECSGGTKRKLSFAMAMVGNPIIVLMDEPSVGMDPHSKRFFGIQLWPAFRCIGSTQHLKNLYGAGYTLEMKLNSSKEEDQASLTCRHNALKLHISNLFLDTTLESDFIGRLVFSVPQHSVASLSECFAHLEEAKTEFNIEEYSFSQTTLEQVFLKFALYDSE